MPLLQFLVPPLPHYIISGFISTPPGRKHPNRRNTQVFDLLVVTNGCLFMGEGDSLFEVREGHALILRPDCHHFSTKACTEETGYYWLHFQTAGAWSVVDQPALPSRPEASEDGSNYAKYYTTQTFAAHLPQWTKLLQPAKVYEHLKQLKTLNQSMHVNGVRYKQQVLFQELVQLLSASADVNVPSPSSVCAEQAASYLRQHYREAITAQTLGESINFHPVYIARCMQKQFGCTPIDYLLRFRIEQAKLLLLQTDLPIARIAEEVGFNQAAYFTSCFAKYESISPRQYRQHCYQG